MICRRLEQSSSISMEQVSWRYNRRDWRCVVCRRLEISSNSIWIISRRWIRGGLWEGGKRVWRVRVEGGERRGEREAGGKGNTMERRHMACVLVGV